MYTVELRSWTPDVDTVSLVSLVRAFSAMSLQASTREVEKLMGGGTLALVFDKKHDAREFAAQAEALGALVDEVHV